MVAAAIKAIKQNNINYPLIWVKPAYEEEIKEAFQSTMKVRVLSFGAGRYKTPRSNSSSLATDLT